MPTEHFGLLLLRMPDRVHAEFPKDERMLAGQILQPQQITLKIALVVQVNIKTGEIDVLRQQVFGRWISGIGKKDIGVVAPSDPNQFLHKFHDAARTEPAHHRARDFVAHQITKNSRMACVRAYRNTDAFGNLFAG